MSQDDTQILLRIKQRGHEQIKDMAKERGLYNSQLIRELLKKGWEVKYPNKKSLNI